MQAPESTNGTMKFFVGPDISPARTTIIGPRQMQRVEVIVPDPESVAHINGYPVSASTRSRKAQGGISVEGIAGQLVVLASRLPSTEAGLTTVVPVTNHTDRSHLLRAGEGFFAVYGSTGSDFIKGQELKKLVHTGEVKIDGEQGGEWEFWPCNREIEPTGIVFRLDPQSRSWIPAHPKDEPVDIGPDGHSREFRATDLKNVLAPVQELPPPADDPYLLISQTHASVFISPRIHGFIDRTLRVSDRTLRFRNRTLPYHGNRTQINAPMIYGGNTEDWHIRAEQVIDPGEQPPKTLVVSFVRNGNSLNGHSN